MSKIESCMETSSGKVTQALLHSEKDHSGSVLKICRGQGHKQGDKLRDSCNNVNWRGWWLE